MPRRALPNRGAPQTGLTPLQIPQSCGARHGRACRARLSAAGLGRVWSRWHATARLRRRRASGKLATVLSKGSQNKKNRRGLARASLGCQ